MLGMMTLKQYLDSKNLTQAEFAARIMSTQGTVSKLCGGRKPSWELAAKIERATDGNVPVAIWADLSGDEVAA